MAEGSAVKPARKSKKIKLSSTAMMASSIVLTIRVAERSRILYQSGRRLTAGPEVRRFSPESSVPLGHEETRLMNLGEMARHGPGDACITLCVGGTVFPTLRSTVNMCPVLADHVARAERNKDVLLNGEVFIDRDPKNFGFILQYLRNRADGITSSTMRQKFSSGIGAAGTALVFPRDNKVLQEIFTEAIYYRLDDLAHALCHTSFLVQVLETFSRGNPFAEVAKLYARLRAGLLAIGTVGTVTVGIKHDIDWLLKPFGLTRRGDSDLA